MRTFASLCIAFCVLQSAFAFDSADWLGKREVFAREAERLRSAYSNFLGRVSAPAENVTVPVETFGNGSVKTLVRAKKAEYFLKEGVVWGEDVEVRRLSPDGSVEGRIRASHCIVDRAARSVWAEGKASVTQGQTTFSGSGVFLSADESYVQVFGRTVIESREIKFGSARKADGSFRGSSRRCDLDVRQGVALFEGDVCARSSDGTVLCADRLYLFLAGTNELKRAVAVGAVSITNGARVGTCAWSAYRRARGEVEMFGDGKGTPARLAENGAGGRSLEGTRIKFWIDAEQVEVENSRIEAGKKGEEKLL